MPDRIIVMDDSIWDQVNVGSPEVARLLVQLSRTRGVQIWTPRENYQGRTDADRRAMDKLEIRVPQQMSDIYRKKFQIALDKANIILDRSRNAAALALHLKHQLGGTGAKIEIMSVDRLVANPAITGGYKVIAPLTQETINVPVITFKKDKVNYVRAHQLLGDRLPSTISPASGQKIPSPKQVLPKAAPQPTLDGKLVRPPVEKLGADPRNPEYAKKAEPKPGNGKERPFLPPPSNGQAAKAAAKMAAIDLGIRGAYAWISSEIAADQKRLFEAEWAKKKRLIVDALAATPTLGALIFAHYSQRQKAGQENDNSQQFSRYFQYITYEFGRTESEAMQKFASRPAEMRPVGSNDGSKLSSLQIIPEKVAWIPPATPIDPSKLPTPFPAEALATFVAGQDLVMDVKWRGLAGFDDAGETRLGVANRLEPLFLVLSAPTQIKFNNGLLQHTANIDLIWEWPEESEVLKLLPLTTVQLDASWRPFAHTSAAMVYPADEYTTALFSKAPPIKGTAGQLYYKGLEHVRFVEPEHIRVLRDFRHERK